MNAFCVSELTSETIQRALDEEIGKLSYQISFSL